VFGGWCWCLVVAGWCLVVVIYFSHDGWCVRYVLQKRSSKSRVRGHIHLSIQVINKVVGFGGWWLVVGFRWLVLGGWWLVGLLVLSSD